MENKIRDLIRHIGDDPEREGLCETPSRVMRSYAEIYSGYGKNPAEVFKIFEDDQIGGLVYMKGIEFYSTCEHHMVPFFGIAHIGYIPNGPVIGASKLIRLLEIFARRLAIQERIATQVTTALMEHLKPKGAVCILEAKHLCISCRGVNKQNAVMGYSCMKGIFLEDSFEGMNARQEFLQLIKE